MDFLDKISDTLIGTGKMAADKAKELAEIANLKGQVSTCDEVIRKNLIAIGKKYYEANKENPDPEFAKFVDAITDAQRGKTELEQKIADRRSGK